MQFILYRRMTTYTIAQDSLSHLKDNLFQGRVLKLLIVGFSENTNFNGDWKGNPIFFQPMHVSFLSLMLDGDNVSSRP